MSIIEKINPSNVLFLFSSNKNKVEKKIENNEVFSKRFINNINKKIIKVEDPSVLHTPGMTEIFQAPITIVKSAIDSVMALKKRDKEGATDSHFHFIRSSISFIYSTLNIFNKISSISKFGIPGIYFFVSSRFLPPIGLLLCNIELLSECFCMKRAINLKNKLNWTKYKKILNETSKKNEKPKIEKIDDIYKKLKLGTSSSNHLQEIKKHLILSDLRFIEKKYFSLSEKENNQIKTIEKKEEKIEKEHNFLAIKKANLARRIRPKATDFIEEQLPHTLKTLSSPYNDSTQLLTSIKRGEEMLDLIDTQCQKRILVHAIGILGLLITIASFALAMAGCPYFVIFLLLVIGGLLAIERSVLSKVLLDSNGWTFNWSYQFPINLIYHLFDHLSTKKKFIKNQNDIKLEKISNKNIKKRKKPIDQSKKKSHLRKIKQTV